MVSFLPYDTSFADQAFQTDSGLFLFCKTVDINKHKMCLSEYLISSQFVKTSRLFNKLFHISG